MSATTDKGAGATAAPLLRGVTLWRKGLYAAAAWLAAAIITVGLPDVIPWGSRDVFAWLLVAGAAVLLVLAFTQDRLGRVSGWLIHTGSWFIALGV